MDNSSVKPMPHIGDRPLSIERDWNNGHEKIVIEGAAYDAEYFRTFAYPEVNMLYAGSQG
jgi:hypothetical protein